MPRTTFTTSETAERMLAQIELARIAQNYSHKRLAQEAGLSHSTYWHWVRRGKNPSVDTVSRLGRVLGLDLKLEGAT